MSDEQSNVAGQLNDMDRLIWQLGWVVLQRKRRQEEEERLREKVVNNARAGATWPVADPRNAERKLWHATVSKTSYVATITDRTKAEQWVREQYPAKLRKKWKLREGFTEADAWEQLREHCGYMFEEVAVVEEWVLNELKMKSQQAGRPMGWGNEIGEKAPPGIEVTKPPSTVLLKITDDASDIVDALRASGIIDQDGNFTAPVGGE
ncbi:hypothetical protein PV646_28430 [Streptomyces sp. ID05-26A]|nr:hypothetical protein [Streptomyces sp. ID05-26A]